MKSEALKHLSRISAAVLASALAVASTVPASAQSDESVAPLTGTWRVKVTQYNCATGMTLLWFWSVAQFSTWWYRVRNYQQSRAPARPAHSRVWLLETGP